MTYSGYFDENNGALSFSGQIIFPVPVAYNPAGSSRYCFDFVSSVGTGSIFDEFVNKTSGLIFGTNGGYEYRKVVSLQTPVQNSELLYGYFGTHYKYKRQQFSRKEINAYDSTSYIDSNGRHRYGKAFKWTRSSQNKKTTVESTTGLLNNSDPIELKKA